MENKITLLNFEDNITHVYFSPKKIDIDQYSNSSFEFLIAEVIYSIKKILIFNDELYRTVFNELFKHVISHYKYPYLIDSDTKFKLLYGFSRSHSVIYVD